MAKKKLTKDQKAILLGCVVIYTLGYKAGKKATVDLAKRQFESMASIIRTEGYMQAMEDVKKLSDK